MSYLCSVLLLWSLLFTEFVGAVEPVDTTYYDLLQVTTTATQQEIRHAYKKLAIKLHPDKNPDPNLYDHFLKVSEAYEILKDADKRLQYDLHGSNPTYARRYESHSQSEYNNLFYNGLYAGDSFVDNLSSNTYFNYLTDGFHFINFYSPFCPPCQKLSDDWKKLAEHFKGLVKVAAVNCKHQNNFCYNVMRISSYPTLLFYQNGRDHRYTVYRGDKSYESLERFVMTHIENEASLATDKLTSSADDLPTAYIIGESWLHKNSIARIALHLKGIAKVVLITDEALRRRLTTDEYNTVVVDISGNHYYITNTQEAQILQQIINLFETLPPITTQKLWDIRNHLRSDIDQKPWVLSFTTEETDKLLAHKLKRRFLNVEFGEINCSKSYQLCLSLQVAEPPAWAIMKSRGAYERFYGRNDYQDISQFIERAKDTENIQTLSVSEFTRIINGESGVWIVAVIPYKISWDHMVQMFVEASHKHKNIQFGIMTCERNSAQYCRPIAVNNPVVIVQNKTQRFSYWAQQKTDSLVDFIANVMDMSGIELSESKFYEILKERSSEHSWAIAFFPAYCDENCEQIKYEWKIVARKINPISDVKVASINCDLQNKKLCDQSNIRSPIVRVYPAKSTNSYIGQLLSLGRSAYMLEWLLSVVDNTVLTFSRSTFIDSILTSQSDLLVAGSNTPWLVYFYSPRCYHCYEMYTDFFIAGMMLRDKVKVGKISCLQERQVCAEEQIMSYPSIKLYTKTKDKTKSLHFVAQHYELLLRDLKRHLTDADVATEHIGKMSLHHSIPRLKHDEF